MFFRSRSVYFGASVYPKLFLPELVLLVIASLVCLVVYGLWVLLGYAGTLIKKIKTPISS